MTNILNESQWQLWHILFIIKSISFNASPYTCTINVWFQQLCKCAMHCPLDNSTKLFWSSNARFNVLQPFPFNKWNNYFIWLTFLVHDGRLSCLFDLISMQLSVFCSSIYSICIERISDWHWKQCTHWKRPIFVIF